MILTVTANPAIDVTYTVPDFRPGAVNRVQEVQQRAGGKGFNVARVLVSLGDQVTATGYTGGPGSPWIREQLEAAGVVVDLVEALPDVRRTVVIASASAETTSLWEPGHAPADPAAAEAELLARVSSRLPGVRAVAVSGSLPPRVATDLPLRVAQLAQQHGIPALLDLDGEPLRAAAKGAAAVLTPNTDELAALTGRRPASAADAADAARELVRRGCPAVIATLGGAGMVAVWPGGAVLARPVEQVAGNPTGAGDAAAAAIVRGLGAAGGYEAVDWAAVVTDAVATSAASVLRSTAGEIDLDARARWLGMVQTENVES